jgi:predicted aspartyl protease
MCDCALLVILCLVSGIRWGITGGAQVAVAQATAFFESLCVRRLSGTLPVAVLLASTWVGASQAAGVTLGRFSTTPSANGFASDGSVFNPVDIYRAEAHRALPNPSAYMVPERSPADNFIPDLLVPFSRNVGYQIMVPVSINGSAPFFLRLDSGATYVFIPQDAFDRLSRESRLAAEYFGDDWVRMADGTTVSTPVYVMRSMTIGGRTVHDVLVAVGPTGSDYLLGQSFLQKFGGIEIDYRNRVVRLRS